MQKNFVLDTNVLLHDPNAIHLFQDNTVIIPIYVIEEIDNFKKDQNDLGRNARQVSRYLDSYRERGNLGDGVKMDNGGILKVVLGTRNPPAHTLNPKHADHLILAVALETQESEPDRVTILVTKDTNLRIRADAMGVIARNFEVESINIDELYPGITEIDVESHLIEDFFDKKSIPFDLSSHRDEGTNEGLPNIPELQSSRPARSTYYANEYVKLRGMDGRSALGRLDPERDQINALRRLPEGVWNVRPRNKEQHFALDCLMDDEIQLVTLLGKAGTGKTMLALAAGLQKTLEEQVYQKLLVSRPIFPLGRDLGYLPGTIEEKLNPWMQPIFDNIEFLMGLTEKDRRSGRSYQEIIDLGMLHIEPLTYIRGRSIPLQYMIVDEAQNLTPHEVKTILTRAGEGTKIVLTGDPYQIDNPYVDSQSNGLTYIINRFKGQSIAATVTLTKGERSTLAELAANLL